MWDKDYPSEVLSESYVYLIRNFLETKREFLLSSSRAQSVKGCRKPGTSALRLNYVPNFLDLCLDFVLRCLDISEHNLGSERLCRILQRDMTLKLRISPV